MFFIEYPKLTWSNMMPRVLTVWVNWSFFITGSGSLSGRVLTFKEYISELTRFTLKPFIVLQFVSYRLDLHSSETYHGMRNFGVQAAIQDVSTIVNRGQRGD